MQRLFVRSLIGYLLVIASAQFAGAIPSDDLLNSLQPTADVNDYAGLLTAAEKAALEARCRQLRERTGAQIAVVTLKSLEGGEVADFTNKLFGRWGVGGKAQDNGLMLLVAVDERRSRIEVGYGLEPVITDAVAGRILDNVLRPHFRNGNYAAGLNAAVDQLTELVERGEPASAQSAVGGSGIGLAEAALLVLFSSIFVAVGSFVFGVGLGAKQVFGLLFGAVFGGIPMLMGTGIVGPASLLLHVPVAAGMAYLGWLTAKNQHKLRKWGRQLRDSAPTTWTWGDSGGSYGGGWTSGGGGFSQSWGGFGGGSSGGGGASGSW